jgi:nitrogen-specific signal transduction histidine kinase
VEFLIGLLWGAIFLACNSKFRECGMIDTGSAGGRHDSDIAEGEAMTLSRLRHDIRNYLNTIKLSTALLHRQRGEKPSPEPLREIDKAADGINELVSRFMGDADAPGLFGVNHDGSDK